MSRLLLRRFLLLPLTPHRTRPFSSTGPHHKTRPAPLPPRPAPPPEDTFTEAYLKGSGPGGQKINKTSSAVQLRHLESGIVVKCQATRSRTENRKIARRLLAEKLDERGEGEGAGERARAVEERNRKRSASAAKKKRRKYRKLEEEKEEQKQDEMGLQDRNEMEEVRSTENSREIVESEYADVDERSVGNTEEMDRLSNGQKASRTRDMNGT